MANFIAFTSGQGTDVQSAVTVDGSMQLKRMSAGRSIDAQTQTLVDVIALCPSCHRTTHFGLAKKLGMDQGARKQLAKVNRWTADQVEEHIGQAFEIFAAKSKIAWRVDISFLGMRHR